MFILASLSFLNEGFLNKAPREVVEKVKAKQALLNEKLGKLQKTLEKISRLAT